MIRIVALPKSTESRLVFLASLAITTAIALWIMHLRRGFFDPLDIPIFPSLFFFQDYDAALVLLVALLLGLVAPFRSLGIRLADECGRRPAWAAVVTTVVLAIASRTAYHAYPLCMDEYAQWFQSKAFAAGRLTGQFPTGLLDWLIPPGFQSVFLTVSHESGRVAETYWPGFALVLTPFMRVGLPWLCNPVLGGLSVLALHRLAMDLFSDRTAAGFAVLFAVASTAFTVNAISFYSMPAHLLCNLVFTICVLRATPVMALCAGLIGGLALVLHNPVPHMLFAAPWLLWLLTSRARLRLIPYLLLGYLPMSLLIGFGWQHLLDDLGRGSAVAAVSGNAPAASGILELGLQRIDATFQWPTVFVLFYRAIGLAKVWLWAAPALVILAIRGWHVHRSDVRIQLLAWSAFATLIGFLFFPADQGHGWGFRYFHSAWFVLPLFAAGALTRAQNAQATADPEVIGYAASCAAVGLVLLTALRIYQVDTFISRHLAQIAPLDQPGATVKFVNVYAGYYSADLVQNDPFLRNPVMLMASHGNKADEALLGTATPGVTLLKRSAVGTVWGHTRQEADRLAPK